VGIQPDIPEHWRALSLPGGRLAAVWHVSIEPTLVRDVDLPPRGPSYTLPDGSRARPPEVVLPETYPLFGRLLTDGVGNLWVMRYPAFEGPVSSWQLKSLMGGWVVDSEGAEWIVLDHQVRPWHVSRHRRESWSSRSGQITSSGFLEMNWMSSR
jgi:hypothetical protein